MSKNTEIFPFYLKKISFWVSKSKRFWTIFLQKRENFSEFEHWYIHTHVDAKCIWNKKLFLYFSIRAHARSIMSLQTNLTKGDERIAPIVSFVKGNTKKAWELSGGMFHVIPYHIIHIYIHIYIMLIHETGTIIFLSK